MNEKHFEVQFDCWKYFHVVDTINERCIARLDTKRDADAYLEIVEENEELKKENKELQLTKNFWKEQCNHRINEYKNYYSINHCPCSADDFVHELKKIYTQSIKEKGQLKQENEGLKQQLADIDKLIYDLGHNEMQRQYEEITKENGENE